MHFKSTVFVFNTLEVAAGFDPLQEVCLCHCAHWDIQVDLVLIFFLNRISLQNDQNVDVVELSASGVFFF